ncbi:MAG: conjugal transfer protein TraF [Nitrospirae bacterium]|nr:conjugal transfer protein TraF [Nitrospirota bacterium]
MKKILLRLPILLFSVLLLAPGETKAQLAEKTPPIKRGWFWYEVKPKEMPKEEKEVSLPSLSDYSLQELWNMHPDQFQPILVALQKKAVMNPTIAAVRDYYTIQDIARRKALTFTNVSAAVMQMYPELSMQAEVPNAVPGITALVKQQSKEIASKISQSKDDFALLYFHSPYCEFCLEQNQIMGLFRSKYDWEIKSINVLNDPDAKERFRVNGIPYIVLIQRGTQASIPISVGIVSLIDLEERIYRGIRLLKSEIRPDEYSMYEFQRGSGLDPAASLGVKTER